MSANVLLTETPKRYSGIIYAPPAYVFALLFVLKMENESLESMGGAIPAFFLVGGFIALFFLFVQPGEKVIIFMWSKILKHERKHFWSHYLTELRAKTFGAVYWSLAMFVLFLFQWKMINDIFGGPAILNAVILFSPVFIVMASGGSTPR